MANTGWTWDQALDSLTVPRFLALAAEWRVNPPAHWLLAAALKYRPADRDAGKPARQPTVGELKAAFPQGKL
ncbi:MAG: hypothetical protein ACLPSW_33490 [Roseiarcus sp.]